MCTKIYKILHFVKMLIPILIFDVALVAWSLHLIQEAVDLREFSLVFAGSLVAASAVAMLVVYFLVSNCLEKLV
jgi:hypothetical protein